MLAVTGREPIPFVGDNDEGAPALEHESQQADVLFRDALACIEHGDYDVRLLDGLEGFDDTELLDRLVYPGPASDARSVDKHVEAIILLERHCDAVSCRAGLVVHDKPLLPQQTIDQRRLAHVGAPDDRDA